MDEQHAKKLLQICQRWSDSHHMKWGLAKCGVVGPVNNQFNFSGGTIPHLQHYTYLGVQHTSRGVDWLSTLQHASAKQQRLLAAIDGLSWSFRSRLTIFKTFIRPITEYCAALTYLWTTRTNPKARTRQRQCRDLFKQNHFSGLKFIFQRRQHSYILDIQAGLDSWKTRLEILAGGLARQLESMCPSNPLAKAIVMYCLPNSANAIVNICTNSLLYNAYKQASKRNKLSWKTWLNSQWTSSLYSSGKLSAYCLSSPTNPDRSSTLFLQPNSLAATAFSWRLGIGALMYLTCTCGLKFSRSHVSCLLFDNPLYCSLLASCAFQSQLALVNSLHSSNTFSPLDFTLNTADYPQFLAMYHIMASKMATI